MTKLYAVRDVKAESYGPPMQAATVGLATRGFGEACADPRSDLNKYPADYMLYELADYDSNSGQITPHSVPKFIVSASEALANIKAARFTPEPEIVTPVEAN